jgi:hypothetical protein
MQHFSNSKRLTDNSHETALQLQRYFLKCNEHCYAMANMKDILAISVKAVQARCQRMASYNRFLGL